MGCIGGADRTFACKSQEYLWKDWYIYTLVLLHFQEGSSSLFIDGSSYALFGPYPNLCIMAPSTCPTGFSLGLWIKSACPSPGGILTTRMINPTETEGMLIFCTTNPGDIKFEVYMQPQSLSALTMDLGSRSDEWFYLTLVWPVGSALQYYEDGEFAIAGNWDTGSLYATVANTDQKLAFGMEFVDQLSTGHGTAYVDGVRTFNRPLTSDEIKALYLSHGNNEMTTDLVTTTEQMYDDHIDISSNLTELNMETNFHIGDAMLSMVLKKVRLGA